MKGKIYGLMAFALVVGSGAVKAQVPFTDRPYTKDEDANFSYTVFNDDHSIVVALKITDPAEASKLAHNGMEIWIDPKGKKNKKTGIHYPLAPTADEMQHQQGGMIDLNPGDTGKFYFRKQTLVTLLKRKGVEYKGFKSDINGTKDVSDTSIFNIATAYPTTDTFYYSVRIPFTAFAEPIDPHHALSVGIIIKGIQFPGGGPDGDGPGGGGPPGGGDGGGPPGDGGPGGPGGPGGDDFRKIFADDAVWQKITLKL